LSQYRDVLTITQLGGEVIVASINGLVVGCENTLMDIRLVEGLTDEFNPTLMFFSSRPVSRSYNYEKNQY
jgi:hypothetical protein